MVRDWGVGGGGGGYCVIATLLLKSVHPPTYAVIYYLSTIYSLSLTHSLTHTHNTLSQIREKFDSGEDVELTNDVNPHDVACLLKEFFRSLPEPLMTVELFGPFISTRSNYLRMHVQRFVCVYIYINGVVQVISGQIPFSVN